MDEEGESNDSNSKGKWQVKTTIDSRPESRTLSPPLQQILNLRKAKKSCFTQIQGRKKVLHQSFSESPCVHPTHIYVQHLPILFYPKISHITIDQVTSSREFYMNPTAYTHRQPTVTRPEPTLIPLYKPRKSNTLFTPHKSILFRFNTEEDILAVPNIIAREIAPPHMVVEIEGQKEEEIDLLARPTFKEQKLSTLPIHKATSGTQFQMNVTTYTPQQAVAIDTFLRHNISAYITTPTPVYRPRKTYPVFTRQQSIFVNVDIEDLQKVSYLLWPEKADPISNYFQSEGKEKNEGEVEIKERSKLQSEGKEKNEGEVEIKERSKLQSEGKEKNVGEVEIKERSKLQSEGKEKNEGEVEIKERSRQPEKDRGDVAQPEQQPSTVPIYEEQQSYYMQTEGKKNGKVEIKEKSKQHGKDRGDEKEEEEGGEEAAGQQFDLPPDNMENLYTYYKMSKRKLSQCTRSTKKNLYQSVLIRNSIVHLKKQLLEQGYRVTNPSLSNQQLGKFVHHNAN